MFPHGQAPEAFDGGVSSCHRHDDITWPSRVNDLRTITAAILLVLAPTRLYYLRGANIKVSKNSLGAFKLVTIILLLVLNIVILAFSIGYQAPGTKVASNVLSCVVTIVLCFLSYQEHRLSIQPSTLLSVYLLASLLGDLLLWGNVFPPDEIPILVALYAAGYGMKFILLVLELQSKASILKSPYNQLPTEATSGISGRLLFLWVNPIFVQGYYNILAIKDIPELDERLASAYVRDAMQHSWKTRPKSHGKRILLLTIMRCLRWPLLAVVFPRLSLIALKFSGPLLISRTIKYVSEPVTMLGEDNTGQILIIAAIFIYTGIAICTTSYKYLLNRVSAMLRGGVVSLVYSQSLAIQDRKNNESAAITLMSTDVDTVADAITNIHEIWAQIVEVLIGFCLLTTKLGWASLVPFFVILCSYKISSPITGKIRVRQKVYMAAIQKRIAMVSSMLGSMKSLKMMGLSDTIQAKVQEQRMLEIDSSKRFRWMVVALNMVGNVPVLTPAATFIVYAIIAHLRGSEPLDTNLAFTSMAIISLVSTPAMTLITIVPGLAAALACLERLQTFLLEPSREDERFVSESDLAPKSVPPYTDIETRPPQEPLIKVVPSISIDQLTVKPAPDAKFALNHISMDFQPSSITMMVGPIGSGKTTFLKAILGELPFLGNIHVSSKEIGYCAQTPWLQNGSIRQNIFGLLDCSEIDEQWLQTVIHACALDKDIALLPDGVDTLIGSRGVILSGGQKHRVALARAIFQRFNTVLLDDILSALDSNTESQVVNRLFSSNGLFRKLGTTVFLATHSTRNLHFADQIVVLGTDGKIVQQGTFDILRSQEGYIGNLLLSSVQNAEHSSQPSAPEITTKVSKSSSPSTSEDRSRKTDDMSVYGYWFKSVSSMSLVAFIISTALYAGFRAFAQYWLKWWAEDGSHMGKYVSVYAVLSVAALLSEAMTISWALIRIGPKIGERLHYTLLQTVMRAPQSFFSTVDTGITLNRFSQDMNLIDRVLPTSAMNVVIPIYIIQRIYLATSRQLRMLDLESRSPLYSQFMETLEGVATIRAFGWESRSIATNTERLDVSQRPYYLMFCIQRWLSLVLDLLVAGLAVLVITLAVKLRSTTSGGQIGIALNSVMDFSALLLRLVETWTQVETSLGAISRLKNFEADTVPEDKPEENVIPPESWPESGGIEFCSVSASYGTPALRDISMKILPGQKVGICGRTGSGKSSLLSILLRLLDLDSGNIIIDGYDTRSLPRNLLRTRVTAIPQDPFVMNSSFRANLDPSLLIQDDKIIAALTKVDLWSIIENRGGLDAIAASQPLSQGQQQLFCLARAMLRRSSILILDEATSSVDVETEKEIRKVVDAEFQGKTVITVAHRIEAIVDCDLVAVLDRGRLVEFGSPEILRFCPTNKRRYQLFLDARQILWLLEHNAISPAQFEKNFLLDSKTIDDRNKSDIFVRVLAVGQALWFCINIIAHDAQGLPVMTLEITTIGIIVDSLLVYYFWKEKSTDVTSIEIINMNMTLSEIILLEEDEAARIRPYFRTPLDFASCEIWSFNLIYHYLMNILKNIRPQIWQRDKESFGRRSDNDVRTLSGRAMAITVIATVVFMGTNFIAWNFQFLTPTERLLWRLSYCGIVGIAVIGLPLREYLFSQSRVKTMQERVQKCREILEESKLSGGKTKWTDRLVYRLWWPAMEIRNNSPEQNPDRNVSLLFAIVVVMGFAGYTLFRAYTLVEDIVALRALPTDAYSTVNWWAFIPHIG
ncbi:hypothetical protein G7Y89_g13820 [Cudoniella acicularis]|uniref:Uncharacterized protein n=1 Tax=Cudoniella acicularis TaxID=354080 RepID=A0A8H4R929_9HELO|nr:hypothetical protein G7Y89_g13820 [Cudoniella acicularis]